MTGTSVLGIKYDGGVLLAADTLASYGSLARFDDVSRLHQAGSHACVAAGGDMSDFQELQHLVDGKLSVMREGSHFSVPQLTDFGCWADAYASRSDEKKTFKVTDIL